MLVNVFLTLERSDLSYYLDYVVIVHRMHGEQLKEEFEKTKKIVLDNLKVSINESTDKELKGAIDKTMNKVMEAKCNHYDYYKLKKLSLGL